MYRTTFLKSSVFSYAMSGLDIPKHGEPAYPLASYGDGWTNLPPGIPLSPNFLANLHVLGNAAEAGNGHVLNGTSNGIKLKSIQSKRPNEEGITNPGIENENGYNADEKL
jgi:hypothetical protein